MFRYKGFDYSLDKVTQAAEEKGLSVDDYVNEFGLETVDDTKEIQTDPTEGKTNGVAETGATVTPTTGQAPETTESNSVDTSLESQQIDNSPEAIFKRRKQAALDQAAIDQFGEIKLEEVVVTAEDPIAEKNPEELLETIQTIDDQIKLLAGDNKDLKFTGPGEISGTDSPKRIAQYNQLIGRRKEINKTLNEKLKEEGSAKSLYRVLRKGDRGLGEFILSIPSFVYEIGSLVSDPVNRAFGLQETDLQKFEESIGTRPLLDGLIEEQEKLATIQEQYKDLYDIEGGITENFKKGNYSDGFYLLGETLAESAPISLSLMAGGAAGLSRTALTIGGGVPLAAGEMRTQLEESPEDTKGEMLLKSTLIGMSEGFFEGVFGAGAAGKVYKNMVQELGQDQAKKTFKQSIVSMYEGALQKSGVPLSMVGNGLEEVATQATQNVVNGKPWNEGLSDAFAAGVGGGALYGAPVNLAKGVQLGKETYQSIKADLLLKPTEFKTVSQAFATDVPTSEAQIKISQSPNAEKVLVRQLKRDVQRGNLTSEQADEIELNFRQTQGAVNQLKPLNLNEQDQGEIVELVKEKNKLQQEIKQVNESALTEPQDQRVKEINDLLKDFSTKAVVQETEKVKSVLAGLKTVSVQKPMSTKEIEDYLLKNNIAEDKSDAIKKSGQGALIVQDPNTKEQTVIVNKDLGNIADGSHEGLHVLVYETIRKSPDTAIRLGESLQQELNKIDPNLIEDLGIRERLELYKEDPAAVQAEEMLTLFSDTVRTGAFKFNENIFTKIGDVIRQFLSSIGVKAKFNNGKDVYNFIKDYQRSIEKGKLTRGQERTATEGAGGRLVGPKIETFVETTTAKESRSEEASQRVQEIYDQQGTAGAFEIIEQFKPITSKLVERRSEAPGFDRQLLTDEIETGQRGIIDLISEYNPDSGVPLAAYINKFLPARAIESSNRILGEEFTEDVTEARGVVAEEATVEVAEETKGPRKPTETTRFSDTALGNLGVKNKAEAEKQISDATNKAFEGQDVTRFGQTKNVPVAVAEIYGKMFGVNPETIYDKKRNYSNKDAEGLTRIKQYLIDNATSDFARLPRTKDDFGKATFVPNNVMNALYTNGELTGTQKDYLDLIREKPIKPIYRDRVGQTIRGLFNTSIRNRMVEDLIPSKPKRARAGVKFSKAKPKDINKKLQEIAVATDINQAAKIAGIKGKVTVNDDNRLEKQKQMQQAIIDAEIPSWMFEGSKFGNFGRRKVDNKYVDIPTRGGLYYGKSDPAFQAALALAKTNDSKYDTKKPKRVNVNKAFTEQGQIQGKDNLKALEFMANKLADAVAKGQMPVEIAALFVSSGYQATSGIIKIAAPFKYKSKSFKYGTTPNQNKGEKFREEHNPPASVIGANLIYGIANNEMATILPAITKNYYQTQLSKADDQKIDKSDLGSKLPEGFSILDNSDIRLVKANISMESLLDPITGKTMAQKLGVTLGASKVNADNVAKQNQLLTEVIKGERTSSNAQKYLNDYTKLESKVKASKSNNSKLPPGVKLEDTSTFDKFDMANTVARQMFPEQANSDAVKSGRITAYEALDPDQQFEVMVNVPGTPVENTIAVMSMSDNAIKFARNADAPNKGISVWDFDDTLATTKSNVLYTMPDGTEGTLTAEQFAKQGEQLLEEGAEFDFSEFEKVTKGAKGPMFEKAVARNRKFGNNNVFILTARTQAAAEPIHQFLKAIGLDIPLGNIVGLGNSTPEAKARWVVGKAAEGYNDFYFADDAYKNVKAVQDALGVLDVKSKVRQAYVKHSKSEALDKGFNDILEQTTGIASEKEYKKVKAEVAGASLGRVFRGIPYSAQDFVGLLYETLSKGKLGDSQMAWYKKHLIDPYARAVNDIDNARLSVMQDYRALKKQLGFVPKNLRKKIPGEPYTREQAVRVYIWNKLGYDVPGISKQDLKELSIHVADNADLQVFADQVIAIQKGDYAKPKEGWPAGTITTDIQESINKGVRAKYLTQWQNNVDVIFSEKNMNKLEAAYGKKWRKSTENMLDRMKTGRNRRFSDDSLTGRFTDWLQGSIGTIMFFNSRSALLQTISSVNFLNFSDNNPLSAAKAFANQKQYWSDFATLINSDFLKARRSGLRINVNEADIADMAKKGGPRAVISKLLQFGFAPTQIADSFAIASGGATFYRNRIKTYKKQGLSQQEAETKAFDDFRENAEESQQSSRPDRISMQQAGPLGRLILAFQNTPSQYARIIDKAVRDLKNKRGDAKTNISKIVYYATVQNLIFNALQQALFAFAFDDEEPEDEEKKDKYISIANGMADSLLRGTGVAGGVVSVTKNAIMRIIEESQKKNPNYEKVGADLQRIAPPISSKLSKINQAARSFKWDKDEMINGGWGLDNPAYLAVGNVVSATTNIPMDRAVKKINNLTKASDSELETWERLALIGGWQDWEIGLGEDKNKKKPKSKKPRRTTRASKERKTTTR